VQENAIKVVGVVIVAAIVATVRVTTVRMTTVRVSLMVIVRVIVTVIALRVIFLFLLLLKAYELQYIKIVECKDTNEIDDETEAGHEKEPISDDSGRTPNANG